MRPPHHVSPPFLDKARETRFRRGQGPQPRRFHCCKIDMRKHGKITKNRRAGAPTQLLAQRGQRPMFHRTEPKEIGQTPQQIGAPTRLTDDRERSDPQTKDRKINPAKNRSAETGELFNSLTGFRYTSFFKLASNPDFKQRRTSSRTMSALGHKRTSVKLSQRIHGVTV